MSNGSAIDNAAIARAVEVVKAGGVVALPTDTVYGIGALAADPRATAQLFGLKSRPSTLSLPILVGDVEDAVGLVEDPDGVLQVLARAFWPGPLTIVMRRHVGISFALGGDETTIGIRLPASVLARMVLKETGPLAVTSANRSGEPAATSAAEVEEIFGAGVVIIDGGVCDGPPSSVVSLTSGEPVVLREGQIDLDTIRATLARG